MIISLEQISKSFGGNLILDNLYLKIEDKDRIGLIGVNGAGKSTLLNIICGALYPDSGTMSKSNSATIGFLKQDSGLNIESDIQAELYGVFSDVLRIEKEMRQAELDISNITDHNSKEYHNLTENYAKLQLAFEADDGYQIEVKINTILNGMGFAGRNKKTPISTLSGGEKTRLALCKLLLEEPNLLILDEPTNHLDFKTLIWLEEYLKTYNGALLIVSHDRYFLDSLVTSICEIEYHKLYRYPGNYTKFVELKDDKLERQQKQYDEQQAEIARLEDYVARNIVSATSSKSAKSKRKAIEHMELIEKPNPPVKSAKLRFSYEREPVKDILHAENLTLEVGHGESKKLLFKDLSLDVMRGEKIAIIGSNGIGKSSLLKAIQDIIPLSRGIVTWGKNTSISYFEQEDRALNLDKTALDELWDRFPRHYEHDIRTVLGNVLITQEDVQKKVSALSGGERAKLKFAIIMLEHSNVLILDEPTNHLDLMSKEVLDRALSSFDGTVLVVSHDRYLLNRLPTKIMEMHEGGFNIYCGNYDYYMQNKFIENKQAIQSQINDTEKPIAKADNGFFRSKKQRSEELARKTRMSKLEEAILTYEEEIKTLEALISSEEVSSDYQKLSECCAALDNKKIELAEKYEEWSHFCLES